MLGARADTTTTVLPRLPSSPPPSHAVRSALVRFGEEVLLRHGGCGTVRRGRGAWWSRALQAMVGDSQSPHVYSRCWQVGQPQAHAAAPRAWIQDRPRASQRRRPSPSVTQVPCPGSTSPRRPRAGGFSCWLTGPLRPPPATAAAAWPAGAATRVVPWWLPGRRVPAGTTVFVDTWSTNTVERSVRCYRKRGRAGARLTSGTRLACAAQGGHGRACRVTTAPAAFGPSRCV